MTNIGDIIRQRRLRWVGHLSRMEEGRIAHKIAFSELKEGCRKQCKPKQRWTDTVKADLKTFQIDINTWRELAANRNEWRQNIKVKTEEIHNKKVEQAATRRAERHTYEENDEWQCPFCPFRRQGNRGRQYVQSHITQKHPPDPSTLRQQNLQQVLCDRCGFEAKSKAGLGSHQRSKHPEMVTINPRNPIKVVTNRSEAPQNSPHSPQTTQQLPANNALACPACGRVCRSKPGLLLHMKNQSCRRQLESGIIGHDGLQ
uniref:C2H2-type domain-containing protein n=1 Tax=Cacopsylla melanoneura TaxID=428564 RepID=A0A8D9AVZ9_9HEMI